ncbi:hypothetical protein ABLT15_28180 [Paraburkholderia tropica]|uniref:hypothetical protein n=1 Tax=Paraburkholderia tropica TaxID=92647 RepID=UPI0032B545E9
MTLADVITNALDPALALLPDAMDSAPARVMLLSIGLQESRFQYRQQIGGPARGFWQFEQGNAKTRGGVWGIYLHDSTRYWLNEVCAAVRVPFDPVSIYGVLAQNDVLACALARLALFADPRKLPDVADTDGAWALYQRVWNPGRPRPDSWAALHQQAVEAIQQ